MKREGVKVFNTKPWLNYIIEKVKKVTLAVIRFVFNSLYQRPHRVRNSDLNPIKHKAS